MRERDIKALEDSLGYHFQRREIIEQALTHSSQARELEALGGAVHPRDNELLEFLGDAVLGLVTSEALFFRFPAFHEGQLSKLRAHLVGQRHLLGVAQGLQLGHYLRLGKGEEKSGGRGKATLLVDALEAVLAALYLDGGWNAAREFILRSIVDPELAHMKIETAAAMPVMDFKSALQERLQAGGQRQPLYELVKEEGPEHKKTFTVEVRLPGGERPEFTARAQGTTKKRAEQEAARQILEFLASTPQLPAKGSKPAPTGSPDSRHPRAVENGNTP